MNEQELREMLERRAGSISAAPTDTPTALRRARRRLVINAALAALLGLSVVAGALTGFGTLRAAPTPAHPPTPTPTVREQPAPLPSGPLQPGRYVIRTHDPDFDASHSITLEVPEGYRGWRFGPLRTDSYETGVSAWVIDRVYADGCRWDESRRDRSPDGTTEGIRQLLASQEGFRVSKPTDGTLDGFSGSFMQRTLAARTDLDRCVVDRFLVWLDPGGRGRYLRFPGQHDLLWIVDVDGVPLVIDASLDAGSSAQDRAQLLRMVQSIRIDPGRDEGA